MKLGARREYLAELRAAISARLAGNKTAPSPSPTDPRMAQFLIFASLAPYEAAKQNGTVAWLSVERMRIYNRISFARDLQATVRDHWYESLAALEGSRRGSSIHAAHLPWAGPRPRRTSACCRRST